MNYRYVYECLVKKALNRTHINGYTEHHHIVPKCVGGTDDASNIVVLTAREHFVAHLLLPKLYTGHDRFKLEKAIGAFVGKQKHRKLKSWEYEKAKVAFVEKIAKQPKSTLWKSKMSKRMSGKNNPSYGKQYWLGKTHSEESKAKISKSHKENYSNGFVHPMLGKNHKTETKEKISKTKTGRKLTESHKQNIVAARIGFKQPQSQKDKVSKALAKTYEITDPNGVKFIVVGLNDWCKKNNINLQSLLRVAQGKFSHHKGYKCQKISQ